MLNAKAYLERPELKVLRITNMRWDLSRFHEWIKLTSTFPRPKSMTHGLWEYPLMKPYTPEWRKTEYITEPEFHKLGGARSMMGGNGAVFGPWQDVAVDFNLLGMPLTRFRLLALAPKTEQHKHVDIESSTPVWRFHLPLLTHRRAELQYFTDTQESFHLPADGYGYFINVIHKHRVVNPDPKKWRLHLVGDPIQLTDQIHVERFRS